LKIASLLSFVLILCIILSASSHSAKAEVSDPVWQVGVVVSEIDDPNIYPNYGVRFEVTVQSQKLGFISNQLSFWTSETVSSGYWAQVGYVIDPIHLLDFDTPYPFYEIFDEKGNNVKLVIGTEIPLTPGTKHTFAMKWTGTGTVWEFLVDDARITGSEIWPNPFGSGDGTYDLHATSATGSGPVGTIIQFPRTMCEERALLAPFSVDPTVRLSKTLEVLVDDGWYPPRKARVMINNVEGADPDPHWGIKGTKQDATLGYYEVEIGSSISILSNGVELWNTPIPIKVSVSYPSQMAIGQTMTLEIKYKNNGGHCADAYISPSFSNNWEIVDYSGKGTSGSQLYPKGSTIWQKDGNQITAQYPLIDFWSTWDEGVEKTYWVKLKALSTEYLWFDVRAAFADGKGNYFRDPTTSSDIDQQGYYVYKYTVGGEKQSSTISCFVSPASIVLGSSATISGTISPAHSSVTVNIYYREGGTSAWNLLATPTTDSSGSYSYLWTPSSVKTYEFKAVWSGDSDHNGDESDPLYPTLKVKSSPVDDHTMCMDVDSSGNPVSRTTSFLTTDEKAFSWIRIDKVSFHKEELHYDDGSSEFGFYASENAIAANKFSVSSRYKVMKVSFYILGGSNDVIVHVLDHNFNSIFSKEVRTPSQDGWFTIDISDSDIIVDGEFYVGWQFKYAAPPWLGVDSSPPHHKSSVIGWEGSIWSDYPKDDEDYLIRVLVCEQHYLRWDWYDPDGKKATSYTYIFPDPEDSEYGIRAWSYWAIKNNYPQNHPGTWQIKTYYYDKAEKELLTEIFHISRLSSSISCDLSSSTITRGDAVKISGSISPSHSDVQITIYYSSDGGNSWNELTKVTSKSDGSYSYEWQPESAGTYQIKAYWSGDVNHDEATSSIRTLTVNNPLAYTIKFDTSPRVPSMTIDGTTYSSSQLPRSFSWEQGSTHTFNVSSLVSGETSIRYVFTSWNDESTSTSRTITVSADATYTATYIVQYNWTFSASSIENDSSGAVLTVDGEFYTRNDLPVSFWWNESTTHAYTYQEDISSTVDGKRYACHNPPSDSVTVTSSNILNPAYHIEHRLTVQAGSGGSTSPAPSQYWHDSGAIVSVKAIPATGWKLDFWELDGSNIGSENPYNITMNASRTLKAVFKSTNPPTTPVVIAPNGGEIWSGIKNITWTESTDPDNDTVTYEVQYSNNTGSSWYALSSGISETHCQWGTTNYLDGANYLIRVRAYDGSLHSNWSQSQSTFVIDNTAPDIVITYPVEGAYLCEKAIWINGTVDELNTGVLQPSINDTRFSLVHWGSAFAFKNVSNISPSKICVMVSLTDLAGNVGLETVSFTYSSIPTNVREALITHLQIVSTGWDQDAVDAANSIVSNTTYSSEDWKLFFADYFADYNFTDDLRTYLGYPVFWWFSYETHLNLQNGLVEPTMNNIKHIILNYHENLSDILVNNPKILQTLMNSHRFLDDIAKVGIVSDEVKYSIYDFYINLISTYPQFLQKAVTFDSNTEPYLATVRAQTWVTLRDMKPLNQSVKEEIAMTIGLAGRYLDLWNDFSVLIMDNNGFGSRQLDVIYDLLTKIPKTLHELGSITCNDLLGNTGEHYLWFNTRMSVNIFNIKVGAAQENSFPSDADPVYSDVFTLVLVHEVNHAVDTYLQKTDESFNARRSNLITRSGNNSMNYLRSMFEDGFFVKYPQEYFASISNQWFSNTSHTLELGLTRFANGYREPINQFLFLADAYSLGSSETIFYTVDAGGNIKCEKILLTRDASGHINSLLFNETLYSFTLDGEGNVLAIEVSVKKYAITLISKTNDNKTNVGSIFWANENSTLTFPPPNNLPREVKIPSGKNYTGILAVPPAGYVFDCFEGSEGVQVVYPSQNPTSITVKGNGTLTAFFKPAQGPGFPFSVYGYVRYANGTDVSRANVTILSYLGSWNATCGEDGKYVVTIVIAGVGDFIRISSVYDHLSGYNLTMVQNGVSSVRVDLVLQSPVVRMLRLYPGYNLISLPVYNTSITASELLNMIGGSAQSVFYFNTSSQRYVTYDRNLAEFGIPQTDFQINPDAGYFVFVNEEVEVIFTGTIRYGSRSLLIKAGYNLVGWESSRDTNASTIVQLGDGKIKSVFWFNATTQSWVSYDVTLQQFGIEQNDFYVKSGVGIFVFSSEETKINFEEQ